MDENRKTAASTAPKALELPPSKAVTSTASKNGTAATNGAQTNGGAKLSPSAPTAEIVAKRQERTKARTAPAAKTVAKAKAVNAPSARFEDLTAVGQENLEACVKCGTIVAKGMETLGKQVVSFTQTAVEANLTAVRNMLTAKTWREAIDVQTDFARDRLETVAAETAKFGELSLKVAHQALEPIQSRIGANAAKMIQPFSR